MPPYSQKSHEYPFHRKRRISWWNVFLGVAIPVSIALVTGGWSMALNAWNNKATVEDVRQINKKLDDIIVRVTQIQCGDRVKDGCR